MRLGIEVGGTFTDLVAVRDGELLVNKVRSTPASPDQGALAAVIESGIELSQVRELVHGSTVATNAVLERRGASIAFVTTSGFKDILHLQRHMRRNVYDLAYAMPKPLVNRSDCYEVGERIDAGGKLIEALDEAAVVESLVPQLRARNYGAVAICLLNSYANPAHEVQLAEILKREIPGVRVTNSHEVVRQFREYERASTTAISAYVQPVVDEYLSRFETSLADRGFEGKLTVMQSHGGRTPALAMRRNAVTALYSGPAAGVMGATSMAGRSGFRNLITFDMGGTSTDICLVDGGEPSLTNSTEVDGLPILTPVLDIVTVGGGGGSIVWIDSGGIVRVGPTSAGADPGPACYGVGGTQATVTDAQLLVGAIRPGHFGRGAFSLDRNAAAAAFRPIAKHLNCSVEEAAETAIRLVNATIVRAIQLVTTARGRDPRDYVLVPFGGAGPLHAAEIADELGIGTVVVPPRAGVLSALGLLSSRQKLYATLTRRMDISEPVSTIMSIFDELRKTVIESVVALGQGPGSLSFNHTLEMRYKGQAFEVIVHFSDEDIARLDERLIRKKFEFQHNRAFSHFGPPDAPIEIVTFRMGAEAEPPDPIEILPNAVGEERSVMAKAHLGGAWRNCSYREEKNLSPGLQLTGPLVIEGETSTTYIPARWSANLDEACNLIARKAKCAR